MPETKFAQFIASKKLDRRRIMGASRQVEKLLPEDRTIKLNKRRARGRRERLDAATKETRKPRSGRPVTDRAIDAALVGKAVSGPMKTRILRAVNRLLEHKKQEKIALKALFLVPREGEPPSRQAAQKGRSFGSLPLLPRRLGALATSSMVENGSTPPLRGDHVDPSGRDGGHCSEGAPRRELNTERVRGTRDRERWQLRSRNP